MTPVRSRRPGFSALLCLLSFTALAAFGQATNKFEREILAFEARDKTSAPPTNAILFVGSSSIRMWKNLATDLSEYQVINRGFGGSQISDCIHYVDRIVVPYQPRIIVFYAGGNDINAGKAGETVFADFQRFVAAVHQKLPRTHIAFISVAPNPARWHQIERVQKANSLVQAYSRTDSRLSFINAYPHMLGPDGTPKPDIFLPDRLHMNENGYAIWKELVRDHLREVTAKMSSP
jgi:lysophospholipase L1-like esterase